MINAGNVDGKWDLKSVEKRGTVYCTDCGQAFAGTQPKKNLKKHIKKWHQHPKRRREEGFN
jgi:hypothetical protein